MTNAEAILIRQRIAGLKSTIRELKKNQIPVRCRECKHCYNYLQVGKPIKFYCGIFLDSDERDVEVTLDDFCAW